MPEHNTLTGAQLHEPKGADTANADEVYIADGAGSGSWENLTPHGSWRYTNIGTGTTITTPSTYTLMNVAGTSGSLNNFTFNSAGRLTYSGTPNRHTHAVCDISFKHSTGGGQDCYFAAYKNGSIIGTPNSEIVASADSANYQHVALHFDAMISTNDYFEIYVKTASGSIVIHSAYCFIMGMPG